MLKLIINKGGKRVSHRSAFNNLSWEQKVLKADALKEAVYQKAYADRIELNTTARRPDIRLILDNMTGKDLSFMNPANHSNGKPESIPGTGDSRAVMVMLKGNTLEDQQANARTLYEYFNLGEQGITPEFIEALETGRLSALVAEAYGPAPFEKQAGRLEDLDWGNEYGLSTKIKPEKGKHAAFGARPPEQERVFLVKPYIYVEGSNTVPELIPSEGICVAVDTHWETGVETTRPINPTVAKSYYGAAFDQMPVVEIHPEGHVMSIQTPDPTPQPAPKPTVNIDPNDPLLSAEQKRKLKAQQKAGGKSPKPSDQKP